MAQRQKIEKTKIRNSNNTAPDNRELFIDSSPNKQVSLKDTEHNHKKSKIKINKIKFNAPNKTETATGAAVVFHPPPTILSSSKTKRICNRQTNHEPYGRWAETTIATESISNKLLKTLQ